MNWVNHITVVTQAAIPVKCQKFQHLLEQQDFSFLRLAQYGTLDGGHPRVESLQIGLLESACFRICQARAFMTNEKRQYEEGFIVIQRYFYLVVIELTVVFRKLEEVETNHTTLLG